MDKKDSKNGNIVVLVGITVTLMLVFFGGLACAHFAYAHRYAGEKSAQFYDKMCDALEARILRLQNKDGEFAHSVVDEFNNRKASFRNDSWSKRVTKFKTLEMESSRLEYKGIRVVSEVTKGDAALLQKYTLLEKELLSKLPSDAGDLTKKWNSTVDEVEAANKAFLSAEKALKDMAGLLETNKLFETNKAQE